MIDLFSIFVYLFCAKSNSGQIMSQNALCKVLVWLTANPFEILALLLLFLHIPIS